MSYTYAELSVAGNLAALDWTLSYVAVTDNAEELFYESVASDRFVLALSYGF